MNRYFSNQNGDSRKTTTTAAATATKKLIRLSKRMSELDICSRREADRWIRGGKVYVDDKLAELGEKVPDSLSIDSIHIQGENQNQYGNQRQQNFHNDDDDYDNNSFENLNKDVVVVLNKPFGYVSGQAEHGHEPAMKLLTRDRLHCPNSDVADIQLPMNWRGYAPAGRLDLQSTGLIIFCARGVIAKKLISPKSKIEKEYLIHVEPASNVSRREYRLSPTFELPKPTLDLSILKEGGGYLLGDEHKPLLPCPNAEWIEPGEIMVMSLLEGRKHHIRRACRQLLGYHVTQLQRIRIGPIYIDDLPEGCWRPLTSTELRAIMK